MGMLFCTLLVLLFAKAEAERGIVCAFRTIFQSFLLVLTAIGLNSFSYSVSDLCVGLVDSYCNVNYVNVAGKTRQNLRRCEY